MDREKEEGKMGEKKEREYERLREKELGKRKKEHQGRDIQKKREARLAQPGARLG